MCVLLIVLTCIVYALQRKFYIVFISLHIVLHAYSKCHMVTAGFYYDRNVDYD